MTNDPIIAELHRHREELFREHGNDPEALFRYLKEQERLSGSAVIAPPEKRTNVGTDRMARR
jgi:hypothetical protein